MSSQVDLTIALNDTVRMELVAVRYDGRLSDKHRLAARAILLLNRAGGPGLTDDQVSAKLQIDPILVREWHRIAKIDGIHSLIWSLGTLREGARSKRLRYLEELRFTDDRRTHAAKLALIFGDEED